MIGNLDPKAIEQVNSTDGVEVFAVPSGAYVNINLRLSQLGAGALDFANGLKHLQRRDRVLQVVQKGQGNIGNDHPIGPAYGVGHCADLPQREYDPDMAKSLIAKSGMTTATLDVAEVGPGLTDICLMLQRECAKIGFDLKINKVPNDGYWGAVWLKTPMHVVSWNMRPTANIMMTLAYKSDAPWNETTWNNERFDSLLVAARGEPDVGKRKEMNCEMQGLIRDQSGSLIATHRSYIDAKSKIVKGLPQVPLGPFGGNEWPEYIWLDA
jgi:peptide/nickel transport system substrate-binding protein